MTKRIVHSQRSGDEGPVGAVRRQNAEGGGVGKKARQVTQAANIWVFNDSVRIVEMEGIMKGIRVDGADRQENYG